MFKPNTCSQATRPCWISTILRRLNCSLANCREKSGLRSIGRSGTTLAVQPASTKTAHSIEYHWLTSKNVACNMKDFSNGALPKPMTFHDFSIKHHKPTIFWMITWGPLISRNTKIRSCHQLIGLSVLELAESQGVLETQRRSHTKLLCLAHVPCCMISGLGKNICLDLFGPIWIIFADSVKKSVAFAQQQFEFLQGVWYLAKATTHSSKIKILWQTKFLNVRFPCLCCCCGMIWPTQWALYRWEKMLCNQNNEITKTYSNHLKSMSLNPAVCVHKGNLHSAESIVNICKYWTYVNTRQCKNLQNTPVGSSSYHW